MHRTKLSTSTSGFASPAMLVALAIIVLIGVMFALVGHKAGDSFKLNNGCKDTNVTVSPVSAPSLSSAMTFQGTLTMGGQPVRDERLTFRVLTHDDKSHNYQVLLGYGQTDANGTATLSKPAGIADNLDGIGSHVTGYEAAFDGASAIKKNEPFYCGAKATGSLTVQ